MFQKANSFPIHNPPEILFDKKNFVLAKCSFATIMDEFYICTNEMTFINFLKKYTILTSKFSNVFSILPLSQAKIMLNFTNEYHCH